MCFFFSEIINKHRKQSNVYIDSHKTSHFYGNSNFHTHMFRKQNSALDLTLRRIEPTPRPCLTGVVGGQGSRKTRVKLVIPFLKRTAKAPEKWMLERWFFFRMAYFQGRPVTFRGLLCILHIYLYVILLCINYIHHFYVPLASFKHILFGRGFCWSDVEGITYVTC